MSWIKKKTFLVIAILIPSLVALILLELFLKSVLGLGQPIVYDKSSIWGYSPRTDKIYLRFDDDVVTINDVGLRSQKSWANNSNRKVLFLGDSVTYGGSFISDEQVFASLACKDLESLSCFNGGVNAYGILNMVARSQFDERIDDADIVVFVFPWGDFLRGLNNSDTAHFIMREPPNHFSATWEVLNFIAAKYTEYLKFGKKVDIYNSNLNDSFSVASFAYENLKNEVKRLQSSGKKVLLISSPNVDEIKGVTYNWINKIESHIINDFPDMYHPLLSEKLTLAYAENPLIFKDSVHLDSKGHLLYSEIIGNILKELELIATD
ncbi:hypothetical protein OAJ80_03230 [Candidatus Thioglobus sp.]|nr:hypothetical protein [Candidatus Thioglobus sp.]